MQAPPDVHLSHDYASELRRCEVDGMLPPDCTTSFLVSHEHLPAPSYAWHWRNHTSTQLAQAEFDDWLCGLKTAAPIGGLTHQTLGKIYSDRIRLLHLASLVRLRHVVKARAQLGAWRPKVGSCSQQWADADVCDAMTRQRGAVVPSFDARARFGMGVLTAEGSWRRRASGRTASAMWWAGQLARHSLRALGQCGRTFWPNGRPPLPVRVVAARAKDSQEPSTLSIAVYVRRGDACMRYATRLPSYPKNEADPAARRSCFALHLYMQAAYAMRARYNATRLFLGTDSPSVVEEVLERYSRDFEVRYVVFDRLGVGGPENATLGKRNKEASHLFIEHRAGVDRALAFSSFHADLALLSSADMFVGTSASMTSRLALLAIIGRSGVLPPFVLLDRPFGQVFPQSTVGWGADDLVARTPRGGWLRLNAKRAELAGEIFDARAPEALKAEMSAVK